MPLRQHTKEKQMRHRLAVEAARILLESGMRDFQMAKRKAASRLGAPDTRNLPSNQEIEQALEEHQRLFKADTQPHTLQTLRETALGAMRFFSFFSPRLVGPVLSGTADGHNSVELHLFAESPEQIVLFLMEKKIPYEESQRRLRTGKDAYSVQPLFRFMAEEVQVELIVFPLAGIREAPRSPIDGKPMRRGNVKMVEELIGGS